MTADSSAPPTAAWSLLARPDRWARWAPHVRGGWGLAGDDGEVRAGARGAARLLGVMPVPARVTAVDPGRSWTWRVAGIEMEHAVAARPGGGSRIAIVFRAPAAVEAALRVGYAPLCRVLLERLARAAAAAQEQ